MTPTVHDDASVVDWDEDGAPRSRQFGDIYFSKEDGLAESRAVFLHGCDLPAAWADRDDFTVAELGFGSGLNIAALLELWAATARPTARLHIFSVEAYPLSRAEAARALAAWPQIAGPVDVLLQAWPSAATGFQRVDLPAYRASLDLAVMDVLPALGAWQGLADAWFLDGFAPATNPQMWSDEVLALVCARSAPGARIATFTVAGQVRRALAEAGATVEKQPGHGRKRQRLEARMPGVVQPGWRPKRVAVIGAGIAGAALTWCLRAHDVVPVVIDSAGRGAGASGNPAALVTPGLDASGGTMARFYAQACQRAVDLFRQAPGAIIAQGVVRLAPNDQDTSRFARIAGQSIFPPDSLAMLDAGAVEGLTGEPSPVGLLLSNSLVVEPAALFDAWIGGDVVIGEVAAFEPHDGGWRITFTDHRAPLDVEVVVLAAGWGCASLAPELRLMPVRGQASFAAKAKAPYPTVFGDYLIPTRTGLLFGATHDRGQTEIDLRPDDAARNLSKLAALRPETAARIDPSSLQNRAAIRATTRDYLPIAGALGPPGLFALTGLGSRGFTTAPLLAEQVCALMLGLPQPMPADLARRVSPQRLLKEQT